MPNISSHISPEQLVLFLTRRCNLRCPTCQWQLYDSQFFKQLDMSFETAQTIIHTYASKGVSKIYIQAEGEVLLHPKYTDIVQYSNSMGMMHPTLITNGYLLDQFIDFAIQNLSSVAISIDGYNAKTYAERRGGDRDIFNRIVHNTKMLMNTISTQHLLFPVRVICVVGKFNLHYIKPMIKFAEALQIQTLVFRNFHPTGGYDNALRPLYADDQEVQDYLSDVLSKTNYRINISLPTLCGQQETPMCQMLFDSACIGSDGTFMPCCHIPSSDHYGLYSESPENYNSDTLVAFRDKFLTANSIKDMPTSCQECPRLFPKSVTFDKNTGKWNNIDVLSMSF